MQSFPEVWVLYISDFVSKRSLKNFDGLYVFGFLWILVLKAVLHGKRIIRDFKSISMRKRFRDWNTLKTQPILSLAVLIIFLIRNLRGGRCYSSLCLDLWLALCCQHLYRHMICKLLQFSFPYFFPYRRSSNLVVLNFILLLPTQTYS